MYWPIGAPRIYAASKHELSHKQTVTFDDGAEALAQESNASLSINGACIQDRDGESAEQEPNGHPQSPGTSSKEFDGLKSDGTPQQGTDEDPGGEIVGLQVTRSGQMFTTITQSTLTVWQTKVIALSSHGCSLLIQI